MTKPRSFKKTVLAAFAVLPIAVLLAGCSGGDAVKIGVVGADDPYWASYEKAAAKEGIDIEIVNFDGYPQLNPALAEGELDMNQFQHAAYLADYNVSSGEDLVPIGATAVYPMGMYSSKVDTVGDITKGDMVAVPNDPANVSRALVLLQSEKLVTLKDGGTIFSDLDDIDEGKSKVTVKGLSANATVTSMPDVAAVVVNNDFVEKAGLKFSDAIAKDDPTGEAALPYVNFFAVRAEDKDNATYKKLVTIFQDTKAVQDGLLEVSGNSAVLQKTPATELQAELKKAEKATRAQK